MGKVRSISLQALQDKGIEIPTDTLQKMKRDLPIKTEDYDRQQSGVDEGPSTRDKVIAGLDENVPESYYEEGSGVLVNKGTIDRLVGQGKKSKKQIMKMIDEEKGSQYKRASMTGRDDFYNWQEGDVANFEKLVADRIAQAEKREGRPLTNEEKEEVIKRVRSYTAGDRDRLQAKIATGMGGDPERGKKIGEKLSAVYTSKEDVFDPETGESFQYDTSWDNVDIKHWGKAIKGQRKAPIHAVIDQGIDFDNRLNNLIPAMEDNNDPRMVKFKQYMISKGLINQDENTGKLIGWNRRVANALSLETLGTLNDYLIKRDAYSAGGFESLKVSGEEISPEIFKSPVILFEDSITEDGLIGDSAPSGFKIEGGKLIAPSGDVHTKDRAAYITEARAKSMPVSGERINPSIEKKTGMAQGIINDLVAKESKAIDFRGPASETDSDILQTFEEMLYQIAVDDGMFTAVTDGDTKMWELTDKAVTYYANGRQLLWATGKRGKTAPGYLPSLDGASMPGGANLSDWNSQSKRGMVSIKNDIDKNQRIQNETKNHLGHMPLRLVKDRFKLALSIAEHVIGNVIFDEFGRPQIEHFREMPTFNKEQVEAQIAELQQSMPGYEPQHLFRELEKYEADPNYKTKDLGGMYSTSPWAKLLGLHKAKWLEHYHFASQQPNATEESKREHANVTMMQKAKEIMLNLTEADQNFNDKIFYNKWFHASANGRYMVRNIILNGQDNKLVRNFVGNARRILLDMTYTKDSNETIRNWKYIIGKNLLPPHHTNNVKTEDMGWNAILKNVDEIFDKKDARSKATYDYWYHMGKGLRRLVEADKFNVLEIESIAKDAMYYSKNENNYKNEELIEEIGLNDPELWGYKFQSFVDFANYHDAKVVAARIGKGKPPDGIEDELTLEDEKALGVLYDRLKEAREYHFHDEMHPDILDIKNEIRDFLKDKNYTQQTLKTHIPYTPVFEPKAQTQHDGKQNGIAIQAIQNGDVEIMELVGLIYSDDENVIPMGDIRNKFGHDLYSGANLIFSQDPERNKFWTEVIDAIHDSDKKQDILKALSKQPLMETSYGKYHMFHFETVINFLESEYGHVVKDRFSHNPEHLYKNDNELFDDLNSLIGNTLEITLDFGHQQVLKQMGKYWSMLGMSVNFKGPLGDTIYMGSRVWEDSDRQLLIPTSEGFTEMPEGRVRKSSQERAKRSRVLDSNTKEWRMSDPTEFGKEVANQLPVLSIQQIDAAVMATAINRVNKFAGKRKADGGMAEGRKFVFPIHDAIITDASSVKDYHQAINSAFVDVNTKYNFAEAIQNSLEASLTKFYSKIKNDEEYLISYDSPRFKSLHDYIMGIYGRSQQSNVTGATVNSRTRSFLAEATNFGWNPKGSRIKGENLKKLLTIIRTHMNFAGDLQVWRESIARNKKQALSQLAVGDDYIIDNDGNFIAISHRVAQYN